jgi:hypothetical protein
MDGSDRSPTARAKVQALIETGHLPEDPPEYVIKCSADATCDLCGAPAPVASLVYRTRFVRLHSACRSLWEEVAGVAGIRVAKVLEAPIPEYDYEAAEAWGKAGRQDRGTGPDAARFAESWAKSVAALRAQTAELRKMWSWIRENPSEDQVEAYTQASQEFMAGAGMIEDVTAEISPGRAAELVAAHPALADWGETYVVRYWRQMLAGAPGWESARDALKVFIRAVEGIRVGKRGRRPVEKSWPVASMYARFEDRAKALATAYADTDDWPGGECLPAIPSSLLEERTSRPWFVIGDDGWPRAFAIIYLRVMTDRSPRSIKGDLPKPETTTKRKRQSSKRPARRSSRK